MIDNLTLESTRQVIKDIDNLKLDIVSSDNLFGIFILFCRIGSLERAVRNFNQIVRDVIRMRNPLSADMPEYYRVDFNGSSVLVSDTEVGKLQIGPVNCPKLRDFTREDWWGFAGAEEPAPGVEPKITEVGERIIVVDIHGITVMELDSDSVIGTAWTRQDKGSFEDNCRYVEAQTCNYWIGLVLDEGAQL